VPNNQNHLRRLLFIVASRNTNKLVFLSAPQSKPLYSSGFDCGEYRIRTDDLHAASVARYPTELIPHYIGSFGD
jgi:hypothetical protein